ncbi:MAG TPA: hypothetical protein VNT54_14455 [Solirubrobacteraceae bacterium]|nr:hypothetical protein [Solirubrobacteraceae bacterium]
MENSTAHRRLVKSPPELWAEVSSEDALARRLAQFGEIRITRLKPETTVAWEGDRASGTVELEPSGWGTKVTLTATPADAPPDAAQAGRQPAAQEPRPSLLVRLLHRRHKTPEVFMAPAPAPEDTGEILAEILDDLGAHHRRPFSRD